MNGPLRRCQSTEVSLIIAGGGVKKASPAICSAEHINKDMTWEIVDNILTF